MTPEAAHALRSAVNLLHEGAEFATYAEAVLEPYPLAAPALALIRGGDLPRAVIWLRERIQEAEE